MHNEAQCAKRFSYQISVTNFHFYEKDFFLDYLAEEIQLIFYEGNTPSMCFICGEKKTNK